MCRLISLVVSRAQKFRTETCNDSSIFPEAARPLRQMSMSKCSVRLINGELDANKQSGLIKVTRTSNWHQLPRRGAAGAATFCSAGHRTPGSLTVESSRFTISLDFLLLYT